MPALIRGNQQVGLVSTEGVVTDPAAGGASQKVIDMDPIIKMLDLETDQFTTMMDDIGTTVATREKVNWLEDEYAPKRVKITAISPGAGIGTTTPVVLQASYKDFVRVNSTLRNLQTGESVRVVAVGTNGLDLTLSGLLVSAITATDEWLITGSAFAQGADVGDLQYIQRVLGFNYGQIHRTAWGFTGTEMEIDQYGGRDPDMEQAKKLVEHRNLLENNAFWGKRSFATVNVNDPKPVGQAGGAYEFITANKWDVNGAITPDGVDNFLRSVYAHGSTDKVGFAHPLIGMAFSKFNRTGQGTYWEASPSNVHGVKVEGFISGAYGYKLPIVVKREWNDIPETNNQFGACMFVIDMRYAQRRPTRNRDTKLLTQRQGRGVDGQIDEYLTESTWQFAQDRVHGLLYHVTSIAP